MSNTVLSLVRTYVPVAVGAFVAWLLTLGVELDPSAEAGLVTAGTGLLIALYYTLARLLERRWPWAGVLLGATTQPTYDQRTPLEREADAQAAAARRP